MPTCVSSADTEPSCVRDTLMAFAMPKSVTTAAPPDSRMFSGLMSRCTTPSACAYASARATSRRIPVDSANVSGPPFAIRPRSDSPFTNGIV